MMRRKHPTSNSLPKKSMSKSLSLSSRAARALSLLLGSFALTAVPSLAEAQETAEGFAVNRFESSERGSEWFTTESMDFRGHVRPALGLLVDYQYRPLAIYKKSGALLSDVITHQAAANLGGSMIFIDRIRVAANLPIIVYNAGSGGIAGLTSYAPPASKQGFGDLRFALDVRVLGEYRSAFTLGVGAAVWVPTGSAKNYTSDGAVRFAPHILAAGNPGPFAYGAKLGLTYRGRGNDVFAGSSIGSDLNASASAGVRFYNDQIVVGPEVFWSSAITDVFARKTTPVEVLLGAHASLGPFRLASGFGAGLTRGYGSPDLRILFGFEWVQPVDNDRDKDGILDDVDACTDVPGKPNSNPKLHGCPDRDGDGVFDKEDACVEVPGLKTDDPKTNGCPADKEGDRDGDGVFDKEDACVDVPGIRTEDPKTNGCPKREGDQDGDGILDKDDACPEKPGLKTSDPKTNGCPDPDRDKDSIENDKDACPDQPGKADPDPAKNGCPKAVMEGGVIRILDQIKFKTGSAVIETDKGTQDILNAVLEVVKAHPEIKGLDIQGHTDTRGLPANNKKLSQDRAASVVTWLKIRGVMIELKPSGFGQERPIDTNDTDVGRRNNRRVEFHIIK
jgi:OmpA-OmpF porin, OOP family